MDNLLELIRQISGLQWFLIILLSGLDMMKFIALTSIAIIINAVIGG